MHVYLFMIDHHDRWDIDNEQSIEQLNEWCDFKYELDEFADKLNNEEYVDDRYLGQQFEDDVIIDLARYWIRIAQQFILNTFDYQVYLDIHCNSSCKVIDHQKQWSFLL